MIILNYTLDLKTTTKNAPLQLVSLASCDLWNKEKKIIIKTLNSFEKDTSYIVNLKNCEFSKPTFQNNSHKPIQSQTF